MPDFTLSLKGRAAVVTGAGVGGAVALRLAQAGAAVLVNDLNPDRSYKISQEITAAGGRARDWQADVANRFQAAAMIETARDTFGRVDILVNAAGIIKTGPMLTLDEWDWRRLLDVNMTGAFFCTQLMARVMAEEGGGVIVNIASTAGHPNPLPDAIGYVASQTGLLGLTKQSARELGLHGIRVNAVCAANILPEPHPTSPPNNALRRFGTVDAIADATLFLCSDAARFITGQALNVDGGESML